MVVRHVLTIFAVEDLARATAFYDAAFEWEHLVDAPVYTELAVPGGMRLGLYVRDGFGRNVGRTPVRTPPGELAPAELYLWAEDLDAATERLTRAGAPLLSARAARDWGDEAAYFADPDGNVVVVARPLREGVERSADAARRGPADTPTRTGSLRLVPTDALLAPILWTWRQEPGARHNMPIRQVSAEDLAVRLSRSGSDLTDRTRDEYRWFIERDGEPVGTVALKNVSRVNGHAEIGYHVAEAHQRRGIGTFAVSACLDLAFADVDFHRVFATISAHNLASQSLAHKLGFRREACLREHHRIEGRFVDQLVFAVLRDEWAVGPR
jgi:RimJ/RimL family protein N-acetyltransferase/predicted enzyme related to lactoylglutathione lyase